MPGHIEQRESRVVCKECGYVASRQFCAHCGQKTMTARLNLESLLLQAIDVVFHATKRAAFTIYELFFRPSATAEAYIEGRRQTYQSPVAVFTLGYLLLYLIISFVTPSQSTTPGLDATLTALGKPMVFVGMCLIATVSHFLVVYPRLYLAETVACFLYVYGSAFVFAVPLVIGVALNSNILPPNLQHLRFLMVDGPVMLFILIQCVRMVTFIRVSRVRIAMAAAFGVAHYVVMRFYFNFH